MTLFAGLLIGCSQLLMADCCECSADCMYNEYYPDISYSDLECNAGVFVSADYLYWYATETNLGYAVKEESIPTNVPASSQSDAPQFLTVPVETLYLPIRWNHGWRVGLGYTLPCKKWDLYALWTHFTNSSSRSKTSETPIGLLPSVGDCAFLVPWMSGILLNTNSLFTGAKGKWNLRFDTIDLQLGRTYCLSPSFSMRPFGAVRGSWTNTKFTADGLETEIMIINQPLVVESTENRFTNTFWGVGLVGGIEPSWWLGSCLSLFGNMDIALLWGDHKMRKKTNISFILTGDTFFASFDTDKTSLFSMQPVLDAALGLRFASDFCSSRFRIALEASWEHHIWFDLNTRYIEDQSGLGEDSSGVAGVSVNTYIETEHDLSLGGLVVRARFDF